MVNYEIPEYIEPAGCLADYLSHPVNSDESIEIAVFQEHRFAFHYWVKWTNELLEKKRIIEAPSLITFDWHQDLGFPNENEQKELEALNLCIGSEVAFYSWARLYHLNDCQIGSAAYVNRIKDVYVICRQKHLHDNRSSFITDYLGNQHKIMIFHDYKELLEYLPEIHDRRLYFDIDLDYFVNENPYTAGGGGYKFTYLKTQDVIKEFSIDNPLIWWIFQRLAGFTIATEPKHCGGIHKSNYFLAILNKLYFNPGLFHANPNQKKYSNWKHLKDAI